MTFEQHTSYTPFMAFFRLPLTLSRAVSHDEDLDLPTKDELYYEILPVPEGPGQKELKDLLEILPPVDTTKGPFLAGGAGRRLLLGESIMGGDVDIFFDSLMHFDRFRHCLERFDLVFESDKAHTFLVRGMRVQLIKRRYYKDIRELFQDFDFSVCQIATDGKNLVCTPQAHKDIISNTLRFAPSGRVTKRTVVGRMIKYLNHGLVPELGLFKTIINSGLDVFRAHEIFDNNELAISYYESEVEIEDAIDAKLMDEGVLRTVARSLGL